jgi:LPXTG-motif cell wall-anchored protein
MRRRLRALVALALVLGALATPLARADGDPASDVLYTQWVFLPFEVKFDAGMKNALLATVKSAKERGYPIKVALITQAYDLGAVPQLYAKPEQYARFLGLELRFLYHGRLLIVMPNGFGVSRDGKPAPRERRILKRVPLGRGDDAMVDAATRAVRRLAASAGVRLPAVQTSPSHGSTGTDRLVIAYAAVGAGLLLAAAWLLRHRKRAGRWL